MDAGPSSPSASRERLRTAGLLVLVVFAVYNANGREIGGVDTIPNTLMPANILRFGALHLDGFRPLLGSSPTLGPAAQGFGATQERDGHLYSSYPVGAAVLATPVYAAAAFAGTFDDDDWQSYRLVAKLAASLLAALAAGALYWGLRERLTSRPAMGLALVFALGTSVWVPASQGMWQHGPGVLCLAIGLAALLRLERREGARGAALAGAALGFAALCRNVNAIPALVFSLYVLFHHRRVFPAFAVPLAVLGFGQLAYNLSVYENPLGGYDAIYQSSWHLLYKDYTTLSAYSTPLPTGLANVLLSPSKGLWLFTPFTLFAFAAAGPACVARDFPMGRYLVAWCAALLVLIAKMDLWWAGSTFGPRYFAELGVPLTLLIAWAWPSIVARRWRVAVFGVLCALSVAVQATGAFFTPCGWHDSPQLILQDKSRLWDWRDNPVARCLRAGPRAREFPRG